MQYGSQYLAWIVALAFFGGGLNTAVVAAPALTILPQTKALAQLRAHEFAPLDAYYTGVQRNYSEGEITDEQLRAEFRVFYEVSAGMEVHYDAWVAAFPKSYAANLARGIFFKYLAMDQHENGLSEAARLQRAREARAEAVKSLYASFDMEPKPILSYLHAIDLVSNSDRDESRRLLDLSLRAQADNFIVREKYLATLRTKAGGSTKAMITFYEESKQAGLPVTQLRKFEGLILEDRGWVAEYRENDYKAAAQAYAAAEKLGVEGCLTCMGRRLTDNRQFDEALYVVGEALRIHPDDVNAYEIRSSVYLAQGRPAEYIADLKAAAAFNSSWAQVNLGVWYMKGIPNVLPKDREAGAALFRVVIAQDPNSKAAYDAHVNLAVAKEEDELLVQKPVIQADAPTR